MRLVAFLLGVIAFPSDIAPQSYMEYVRYLASPQLKGRRTGSPELNRAADYIAAQFKKDGVAPVSGSYFEDFEVTAKTGLGPRDSLVVNEQGMRPQPIEKTDYIPLNVSANGSAEGGVVFVGYGITAPEKHYDDYAGIEAKDRIVFVLRHAPKDSDTYGENSTIASKVVNAKLHGARAVLLVNDLPNHSGDPDEVARFETVTATEDYGILVDQVTVRFADRVLAKAQESVGAATAAIDRDGHPHSFVVNGAIVRVRVDLTEERRTVHNVLGYVPGSTDEYVVIGAHYDHLGLGEQYSLAPSLMGTVHPGADDNASGTAGVMELAAHFAHAERARRGFLFLCFAGEEEGLLGSNWYVNHPSLPLKNAVAMINMDMIGRLRDNKVYVGGVGTGSSFAGVVKQATAHAGFAADESEAGGYGASDHTSFTTKQIPTLFFFSGLHSDYHKPSDTADKINAPDAVRLLDEIAEVAGTLANAQDRPEFVRVAAPAHGGSISSSSSGSSGYGPYFGSIPDFGGSTKGVRFSDVRDGSPAAKAGYKAGDVMVEFDGKPIQNLYDFTYALRAHKPGDTVTVKVMRDGQPVIADVLLTKRQ